MVVCVCVWGYSIRHGDSVDNTVEHLIHNPNVPAAISKGMQAVKLCTEEVPANAG